MTTDVEGGSRDTFIPVVKRYSIEVSDNVVESREERWVNRPRIALIGKIARKCVYDKDLLVIRAFSKIILLT